VKSVVNNMQAKELRRLTDNPEPDGCGDPQPPVSNSQ
jgi:hypothetical protein